jgi:hypothetical protein
MFIYRILVFTNGMNEMRLADDVLQENEYGCLHSGFQVTHAWMN